MDPSNTASAGEQQSPNNDPATGSTAPAPSADAVTAQASQSLPAAAPGAVPAAGAGTGQAATTTVVAESIPLSSSASSIPPGTTSGSGGANDPAFNLSAVDAQPPAPGTSEDNNAGPSQSAARPLRSSGRHIRPTAKLRQMRGMTLEERKASGLGDVGYAFRARGVAGSTRRGDGLFKSGTGKTPRLKLSLKSNQAGLGTGQGPKTAPYMQGYTRELDSSDDETGEGLAFEEQMILRFPEGKECDELREMVRKRQVGEPGAPPVWFKFKDARRAVVCVGNQLFSAKLVDLPTISETHKTLDNKQFFKVADISQMLLVTGKINDESEVGKNITRMGDLVDPVEAEIVARVKAEVDAVAKEAGYLIESSATANTQGVASSSGFDSKNFVYPHGLTPPMNWARERRFRKVVPKRRGQEAVLREVERLLAEDEKAEDVQVDMITNEEAEAELRAEGKSSEDKPSDADSKQRQRAGYDADGASVAATPAPGEDDMSMLGEDDKGEDDGEEEEESENEEVDRDLAAALDAVLDENEDDDASDAASLSASMSGRQSRAESQLDDEDDLFDGDEDDEGPSGEDDDEEDEEDDDNAEMNEFKARQRQLNQEIRDIEQLVKRRREEMERHNNPLLKQRARETLNKALAELESKKSQLADVAEERRQAVADMQAEEEEAQARADVEAAAAASSDRQKPAEGRKSSLTEDGSRKETELDMSDANAKQGQSKEGAPSTSQGNDTMEVDDQEAEDDEEDDDDDDEGEEEEGDEEQDDADAPEDQKGEDDGNADDDDLFGEDDE